MDQQNEYFPNIDSKFEKWYDENVDVLELKEKVIAESSAVTFCSNQPQGEHHDKF